MNYNDISFKNRDIDRFLKGGQKNLPMHLKKKIVESKMKKIGK